MKPVQIRNKFISILHKFFNEIFLIVKNKQIVNSNAFFNVFLARIICCAVQLYKKLKGFANSFLASFGHCCGKCGYLLNDDDTLNVFHNVQDIEKELPKQVKMSLVYIAGYITRNDPPFDDTLFCFKNYGDYLKELNRGGLTQYLMITMCR